MSCCGEKRKLANVSYTTVKFTGNGVKRVLGNVTGRIYSFDGSGSLASVDNRDLSNILALPNIFVNQ